MKVEDIINFIKLYQMYPCLWNPKDDNFRNRKVKLEALNEMAFMAGATPLEVEKKIAICLSQNRRARRKAVELRKTGMNEKEIEKCVWYGYKHLNFLNEVHAEIKAGKQELEETLMSEYDGEDEDKTHQSTEDDSNLEDPLATDVFADISTPSTSKTIATSNTFQNNIPTPNISNQNNCAQPNISTQHSITTQNSISTQNIPVRQNIHTQKNIHSQHNMPTTRKRNRTMNELDQLVYETCKTIKKQNEQNENRDETKIFCEYMTKKMKKLDIITRRDVEHKINCILYEAEMKILHNNYRQPEHSNNDDDMDKFQF